MRNRHIAIVDAPLLELILCGRKCIESRFSRSRRAPFGQVAAGDTIYFRAVGGDLRVAAVVARVEMFDQLTRSSMRQLERIHGRSICADDNYWRSRGRVR